MSVCGCASPDCAVNGCNLEKRAQEKYYTVPCFGPERYPPLSSPSVPQFTFTPKSQPLTEEDVRRIIREELKNASKRR